MQSGDLNETKAGRGVNAEAMRGFGLGEEAPVAEALVVAGQVVVVAEVLQDTACEGLFFAGAGAFVVQVL